MTTIDNATRPIPNNSPDRRRRRFDLTVDAKTHDDPAQRHRNDDGLEGQRNHGGDIEMRGVLDVGCQATDNASTIACTAKH